MHDTPPKDLLKFPVLVGTLLWQLVYYTFTEVETLLLAVVAALLGYRLGVLWGVTIYLSVYFAMRMVGGYVSMFAQNLQLIARGIVRRDNA